MVKLTFYGRELGILRLLRVQTASAQVDSNPVNSGICFSRPLSHIFFYTYHFNSLFGLLNTILNWIFLNTNS